MNPTASFKRAIALVAGCSLLGVLSGCAGTMTGAAQPDAEPAALSAPTGDANAGTAETTQAATNESALTSSRMLLSREEGGLGLEFVDGPGFNRVLIETSGSGGYEVSRLEDPPRLVVDLLGRANKRNQTFDTGDSELVSRIRIGSHPEKTRLVLDLPLEERVEYRVDRIDQTPDNKQGNIAITLARSGQIETAMSASSAARAADQPEARFAEAEGEGATLAQNQDATATSEIIPVAAGSPESSVSQLAKIDSIELQPLSAGHNMLLVQMSDSKPYALEKTAPSEYVLKIENAGIDPDAATTVLAPPGTGAIRSVRPVSEGDNLLLRIFSTPNTRLEARASSGKIVVASAGAVDMADARAQMSPDEKAPAAAEPAAPVVEKPGDLQPAAANAPANEDAEISALISDQPKFNGRLISLDLQDTDIDNALRIIAEVSNLNIIASEDVTGKVTLRLVDVPWDQALDVILKTNGLDKVREGNVIRIAPVEKLRAEREALKLSQRAEEDLEPLQVRYIRVSYSKAAEMKPLVESVLTERGSVAYDDRTNQLIVKDIMKGIRNTAELVSKLDLRTPQVLLETQIVEANRTLMRDLGAEFGFKYVQSPATGNPTGYNFPNAIAIGGSVSGAPGTVASFPGTESSTAGSAISFLLDSADGTKGLALRLTALENEGRVRVISRPAVATTNNKQAVIKSVEKIRIKTPSGGLSVATGAGASASGTSAIATESVEIGIVLEVTPQASPDYFVLLDINAKSSTLGSTVVDGIPSEIERSATSSVLVSSGQTFAMGGIYKISDRETLDGVPFLKDIPVLGYLFRRQKVDNSDEELLFFLTPRIIEGSFDDAAMRAVL